LSSFLGLGTPQDLPSAGAELIGMTILAASIGKAKTTDPKI
jgi:hypothetical protein